MSVQEASARGRIREAQEGRLQGLLIALGKNKVAAIGMFLLLIFALSAAFAPIVAPHDPLQQDLVRRLTPPSWQAGGRTDNLLGTDALGRDILSRMIYGVRTSLLIAVAAVSLSGAMGTLLGLWSGYYRGRLDDVIMRVADIQLAFPFVLLAISIVAVLGPSIPNLIMVLAITSWVIYARVVRGEVLALREREFVEASRASGCTDRHILFVEILPNILTPVIVIATFEVAKMIIWEASMSFLGLGVPPPTPSWGTMIADGRGYLSTSWWLSTFPGIAIMITVLAANLTGDWLRTLLDPRLKL